MDSEGLASLRELKKVIDQEERADSLAQIFGCIVLQVSSHMAKKMFQAFYQYNQKDICQYKEQNLKY